METTKLNYDTTCMDLNAFLIEWCNLKIFCCWIGEVLQRSMVASFPRNQLASYCFHIFVSYYCPYAYMTKLSFFFHYHTHTCVCVCAHKWDFWALVSYGCMHRREEDFPFRLLPSKRCIASTWRYYQNNYMPYWNS